MPEDFRDVVKRLRAAAKADAALKPAHPVRIVVAKNMRDFGSCRLVGLPKPHFRIRIAAGITHYESVDTLMHEWSHALDWDLKHENDDTPAYHDDRWGVCYARVYRAIRGG